MNESLQSSFENDGNKQRLESLLFGHQRQQCSDRDKPRRTVSMIEPPLGFDAPQAERTDELVCTATIRDHCQSEASSRQMINDLSLSVL
jgi:hypothetical protein